MDDKYRAIQVIDAEHEIHAIKRIVALLQDIDTRLKALEAWTHEHVGKKVIKPLKPTKES